MKAIGFFDYRNRPENHGISITVPENSNILKQLSAKQLSIKKKELTITDWESVKVVKDLSLTKDEVEEIQKLLLDESKIEKSYYWPKNPAGACHSSPTCSPLTRRHRSA